ncbi:DUF488 family protein [Leptospira vanthielii]|uniref:PF04343 family protein n=1 Tax=Leptospira vanthielii serovar Holland str. Waz Holland = ATCC 700522 TaxID=1218591 RepID=N1WED5_9LEPT|nr:DUF488 family protein [Leptospira vanthielii]EMY71547.1 PF04343 family protein [Leptospira vanthielii serovar Holland str. Waz Holland = ATCC 700522]
MYYRRKVLLAILEKFGGRLSKTDLQKYLFLFSQKQSNPAYDFYPYRFGCYSAQATQDLGTLKKYELVQETPLGWELSKSDHFFTTLKAADRKDLVSFHQEFRMLTGKDLIRYVYTHYPFYAIHSEIAKDILSINELANVDKEKPKSNTRAIFTIGYEGKSIEKYVTELIRNSVHVLCDVRKNPLSMKYGFSKKQLKGVVESVGIQYIHFPGLGIVSSKRQELNSKSDYQKLFLEYQKTTLRENQSDLRSLNKIYEENARIALTCFEADSECCHRSHTANALLDAIKEPTSVIHL